MTLIGRRCATATYSRAVLIARTLSLVYVGMSQIVILPFTVCFVIFANSQPYSGGYSTGVPPLPIPNREVKPCNADGTARAGE